MTILPAALTMVCIAGFVDGNNPIEGKVKLL